MIVDLCRVWTCLITTCPAKQDQFYQFISPTTFGNIITFYIDYRLSNYKVISPQYLLFLIRFFIARLFVTKFFITRFFITRFDSSSLDSSSLDSSSLDSSSPDSSSLHSSSLESSSLIWGSFLLHH